MHLARHSVYLRCLQYKHSIHTTLTRFLHSISVVSRVEMEDRRVTRSMTSSQNGPSSKRSRRDSPSPPGQSSSTSAPRKTQLRSVAFLHPSECMEKPEDLAEMSRQLMQNPQLLEKKLCKAVTPFIAAILLGHEKCAKFLLENKAKSEIVIYDNINALSIALMNYEENVESNYGKEKWYNIIKMLLNSGNDPNFVVRTIVAPVVNIELTNFMITIQQHSIRLVRLLLNYNVKLNQHDTGTLLSVLNFALLQNNEAVDSEIVKLLLENGAQCKFGEMDDLFVAIQSGHIKAVKYIFLYHGSPVIHSSDSVFHNQPYSYIVNILVPNFTKKIEMLKLMHKFGVNLWKNETQHEYESEDEQNFYEQVNKIRGEPLSLKCLSRIKILHTMGRNFVKKYKELEIPTALHEFLEFPDV